MSKDPYRDANAPPPYEFPPAPAPQYGINPGGMYPQAGPQYGPPPTGSYGPPQAAPYVPPHGPQYNYQPAPQAAPMGPPLTITRAVLVGPDAVRTQCPSCHANIKTAINYNSSMKTHLCAIVLCLMCCWPCVCVPYCMASCKDTTHTCPNCRAFLGVYRA